MKSSELREKLRELEEEYGDLEVRVDDRDMAQEDLIERVWYEDRGNTTVYNAVSEGKFQHWFQVSS